MAQAKIDRFINRSHATLSQGLNYAVAALQDCIGRQQGCAGVGSVYVRGGHYFYDPEEVTPSIGTRTGYENSLDWSALKAISFRCQILSLIEFCRVWGTT